MALSIQSKGLLKCNLLLSDTKDDVITKPDSIGSFTLLTLIMPY